MSKSFVTSFRRFILRLIYPILKFVGKVELPKRKIHAKFYYKALVLLEPGDVCLTRTDWSLTNLIIPGKWKHAAIYVGKIDGVPTILEAIGKGVVLTPLVDFILTKDHFKIRRAIFATSSQAEQAAIRTLGLVGKKYDYQFIGNADAFYCAEVIWWGYDQIIQPSPFQLRKTLGELTATADDYAEADKMFSTIMEQCSFK